MQRRIGSFYGISDSAECFLPGACSRVTQKENCLQTQSILYDQNPPAGCHEASGLGPQLCKRGFAIVQQVAPTQLVHYRLELIHIQNTLTRILIFCVSTWGIDIACLMKLTIMQRHKKPHIISNQPGSANNKTHFIFIFKTCLTTTHKHQ